MPRPLRDSTREHPERAKHAAADAFDAFYEELSALRLAPLWEVLHGLVPAQPAPSAQPYRWPWEQLRAQLLRAGHLITAEQAERRVLILENPGLRGRSQVTDTLFSGVQLILPGEIAPAHRHSQSALRFVLEGAGGYTSVEGARTAMSRGDFIVTPPWTWHDHGNTGTDPVIWLDGLDVPLVAFLKAGFRENYPEPQYAVTRTAEDVFVRYANGLLPLAPASPTGASPIFSYPYVRTREVLDRLTHLADVDPHHGVCVRYANPLDGAWAMPTLAASMRLLPSGFATRYFRSTDSAVLVAVEGSPTVEIQDRSPDRLSPGDVFAVPGWTRWRVSAGSADAVIFVFSDRPVHEKLGLYREQRE